MSLVAKVEELGAAVSAGLLARDVAVQHLVEYDEARLTRYGAGDLLDRWWTCRARYDAVFARAEAILAELASSREPVIRGSVWCPTPRLRR